MPLVASHVVHRAGARLAVICLLVLAALGAGAVAADQAAASHPHCWTRGHYITPQQFGTWNNTIGHRVVCGQYMTVDAQLWRFNRATGVWTVPRTYNSAATVYSNGSYVNTGGETAPLFRGSNYVLRLIVRNPTTGEWTQYDGPAVSF